MWAEGACHRQLSTVSTLSPGERLQGEAGEGGLASAVAATGASRDAGDSD